MKLHTEQLGDKSHQQPDSSADTIQPTELAIQSQEIQPENNTGLPDNLKTGVENLSGMGMDDVKVHYNSSEPPKFQAAAYTQGTDIHVAPGQEKHLPHEAWHVVQQKQGRVKPSIQLKGISANVDSTLEKEADVMGAKANSVGSVMSRLPSASQVKESIQSFGQTKPTTPPTKLGNSVRQFKCFGSRRNQASNNPQSEPEVVTSSKQEVDRTDQQFPPSEVDPKILAKSIEPKAAKIKSDIVGHLNLVPYDVATVTTWLNSMGEFPREEVPTVLYHPREETIMYHTTTTPAAQSILQTGLDPTYGGTGGAVGTSGEANAKGYIYLCNNETYACVVAKNFFGDTTKYNEGLTILQVIVDPSTVFVSDPDLASAVRTTRKLTNIKRYATVSNKGKIIAYSDEAIRPTEDVESDD
ncbi:DUF4157 domain-containing protein [Nostoc sp. FACHB-190]|nr:DUF4157 domain-containing protein [Nostoc sp. FACHB-190]